VFVCVCVCLCVCVCVCVCVLQLSVVVVAGHSHSRDSALRVKACFHAQITGTLRFARANVFLQSSLQL